MSSPRVSPSDEHGLPKVASAKVSGENVGTTSDGSSEGRNDSSATNLASRCASISLSTVGSASGSAGGSTKPIDVVVANYDYLPSRKSQLRLYAGEVVYVMGKHESGWWDGVTISNRPTPRCVRGWFPHNFTKPCRDRRHNAALLGKTSNQRQATRSGGNSRKNSAAAPTAAAAAAVHMALGSSASSQTQQSRNQAHGQNEARGLAHSIDFATGSTSEPTLSRSVSHSPSPPPHLKLDYRLDMRTNDAGNKYARRVSLSSATASAPPAPMGSGNTHTKAKSRSKSPFRAGVTDTPSGVENWTGSNQQQLLPRQPRPLQQLQIDPLQRLNSFEDDRRRRSQVGTDKMTVLSPEEVEMIFNNINDNSPPLWTPVATTEGKVLYYNRDHDVYCSSLPFLQLPELSIKSIFSDHDWYVDLNERTIGQDRKVLDQSRKNSIETWQKNQVQDQGTRPTVNARNSSNYVRAAQGSRRPSVDEKSKNFIAATLLSENGAGTGIKSATSNTDSRNDESSTKKNGADFEDNGDNNQFDQNGENYINQTNSDNHPNNDIGTEWWQKSAPAALRSKDELFFHHKSDIRTWAELRDTTLYYARKAYACFFNNDYQGFNRSLEMASKYVIYHHNACRLLKSEIIKNNAKKGVKRLLRQLLASASAISINGSLFFCSPQRYDISFYPSLDNAHKSSIVSSGTAVQDPLRVSISTINPLRQGADAKLSIGNEEFFFSEDLAPAEADQKDDGDKRFGSVMSAYTIQAHSTAVDENSNLSIQALFRSVDSDFSHFMKSISDLYDIMKSCCTDGVLPQLLTRFFRDCFSGGAWTSTFQDDPADLSPRNSFTAFGSVHDPFSRASNVYGSVSSKTNTINSSALSKGSADYDKSTSQRESAKSKPLRKNKYPLTDETLNYMKKKIEYFTSVSLQSYEVLLEQKASRKRNLEISANCHRELSHCVSIIDLLENLDLRFFQNMKNLGFKTGLDQDSEELRQHAMTACASLLMEFFDVKQALYDATVRKVMDIQNLTLEDPFVFCSMAGDQSYESGEPLVKIKENVLSPEKLADAYCSRFISEDVELNNIIFFDSDAVLKATQITFLAVIDSAYQSVEQLMQERENILNYAARMMKYDLIGELMSGEQENRYMDAEGNFADSEIEHIGPRDFGKSQTIDVPWYLDSEHEFSLLYDHQGSIKGGSKGALLEHLTSHQTIDASFNIAMLLSFRSIFTTSEFLHALVERYHLYPPEGLSFEEYSAWIEKKSNLVKARVVNIMKTLFSQYWTPAYYEPGIDDLVSFAQLATAQNVQGAPALLTELKNRLSLKGNLKNFIPEAIKFDESGHNYGGSALNVKTPTTTSVEPGAGYGFRMRKLKLLDVDPQTFAKQLTTKEHFLYSKITPFGCLDRIWGKRYCKFGGSEDISNFISIANSLTNYVSFAIVKHANVKKRAKIIQHFIYIAEHTYELNNFSSMTAIISALYSSPIFRLKKTWEIVPPQSKKALENLNTLMDPAKNFYTYRNWLKNVNDVPCVPFLGVYLSDLTFVAEGNPDYLHRSMDIINFSKRLRIVGILREIASYQNIRYKFKRYDDIQAFIEESIKNVPNIEKQYEQSLRIEPRADISAGLSSTSNISKANVGKKLEKRSRFIKNRKRLTK
ncbi:LAME_0H03422g1_1 [Lachancea meyersii CBS 8951]|uniref:LAME_0H03422g1_1 n=1 Tax=Lachancea meyersii CBS 8951 TaxID=1266667 RepID=A0A1G4KDR1_9SACH|nr:LAME_0H03422g1_1 [Lachancea meyersii CBS 8951]